MSILTRQNIDFNRFEIIKTGLLTSPEITSFSASAGTWSTKSGTSSTAHGLGFTPIILAFLEVGGLYIPMPYTATVGTQTNSSAWYTVTWTASTNDTNIDLSVWSSAFGTTNSVSSLNIRYYLLKETAKS